MDKSKYKEPSDYIPKEIRKKYKLGEFAEENKPKKTKRTTKK